MTNSAELVKLADELAAENVTFATEIATYLPGFLMTEAKRDMIVAALRLAARQDGGEWRPIDNEIFTLQCAVENLRAERTERTVEAAGRIAADLEKIAKRLSEQETVSDVRAATIEECARVADDHATATCTGMGSETAASQLCARSIAGLIRQLKISDEQRSGSSDIESQSS